MAARSRHRQGSLTPRSPAPYFPHRSVRAHSILGLALCLLACEDNGPEASPADLPPLDVPAFPDLPDAGPMGVPVGGPCEADEACVRGLCVHGVCSTVCARAEDCTEGTRCVQRGGTGRCTRGCGQMADCGSGEVCAVEGPDRGFCVAPGPGLPGSECETREDCSSWVCAGGRCLAPCEAGCGEEEACLELHTQSVCVGAGAGPAEAPCGRGEDCASGVCRGGRCSATCREGRCPDDRVCFLYESLALCERRCASSADCGDTGVCVAVGARRMCVTRGGGVGGEECARPEDCASGRCLLGTCAPNCEAGACGEGRACVEELAGAICRPAGSAPLGAECSGGEACASGLCGGGVCSVDCADGRCAEGSRCTRFADGDFCFQACTSDEDCPSVAFCDPSFTEGATCFWRGGAEDGARCARHLDCRSGRCAEGLCRSRCPDGRCPAGQRCLDFGTGAFCASEPLPGHAACDEGRDTCAPGLRCVAGRCMAACEEGVCPDGGVCGGARCYPGCEVDLDCRPGRRCNRFDLREGFCEAPGDQRDGAACSRSGDCLSGLCFEGRCAAACEGACPDGLCVGLGLGAWCLQAGSGELGAACEGGEECLSGLCAGRRCAGTCEEACCEVHLGAEFCLSSCTPGEDACAAEEVCAPTAGGTAGRCELRRAGAAAGEPCEALEDCELGLIACLDAGSGAICREACSLLADGGCEVDSVCVPLNGEQRVGACVPAGAGGDLASCERHDTCAAGRCLFNYLEGRCGRACLDDADCGESRCVDLVRDPAAPFRVCAPRCEGAGDCAEPLSCRRDLQGQGACY